MHLQARNRPNWNHGHKASELRCVLPALPGPKRDEHKFIRDPAMNEGEEAG
jgi:hypothetical protein